MAKNTNDVKEQSGKRGFQNNPEDINREGAPEKAFRWKELFLIELDKKSATDVKMTKKVAIARGLVDKAENGDIQAFDRIADRTEGKPKQSIVGGDDDDDLPIMVKVSYE